MEPNPIIRMKTPKITKKKNHHLGISQLALDPRDDSFHGHFPPMSIFMVQIGCKSARYVGCQSMEMYKGTG